MERSINSRLCATTVHSITKKDQYLTNSKQYNSTWEAGSYKTRQGTPNILSNPQIHYSHNPEPHQSTSHLPTLSSSSLFQLSSHKCLGVPRGPCALGFPIKSLYALHVSPYICHHSSPYTHV